MAQDSSTPEQSPISESEFAARFETIRRRLLRHVGSTYIYNQAVAKDIVQQTAAYVLEKLQSGVQITPKQFAKYCRQKASWLSIDYLRQVTRDRVLNESDLERENDKGKPLGGIGDIPQEELDPDVVEVLDLRTLLERVSADLSHEEWTLFSLSSQGHSAKEVGKALAKTPNNIAQIRFKATLRIQEKYGASIEAARRKNDAQRRQYQQPSKPAGPDPREGGSALRGASQPS